MWNVLERSVPDYEPDSDSDIGDCEVGDDSSLGMPRYQQRRVVRRMSFLNVCTLALMALLAFRSVGISILSPLTNLNSSAAFLRTGIRAALPENWRSLDSGEHVEANGWGVERRLSSSCNRNTGSRCFEEGSTIVETCNQDDFGVQVQCDIRIDGGLFKGVEGGGGECLCPIGYCPDDSYNGKCIAQEGHVPWNSSYVTTSRAARLAYVSSATNDPRRKELTMQAIEECEGVPYESVIILKGNPQQSRCIFAREVIETCGYEAAIFWLRELEDQGGLGRFLSVAIVGLLLAFFAKIGCAILIMYLATVVFQDEVVELLVKAGVKSSRARKGPTFSQMSCKQRVGLVVNAILKVILTVGGIYVIFQLLWIALFNTVVFLDKHREFTEAIKAIDGSTGQYQDPCRFWMSSSFIQYGQLAELLALCFISWFDVVCWIVVACWTIMLCLSSCCWCLCCCCSYIWCCVCCKNCTCLCFMCGIAFSMCGSCMVIIITIPLLVCVIAFLICLVVWLLLAAICIAIFALCVAAVIGCFLVLAYAFAKLIAIIFRFDWPFTLGSFLKTWAFNVQVTFALLAVGDRGLKLMGIDTERTERIARIGPDDDCDGYGEGSKSTTYCSTTFLMYIVKNLRMVLVAALLLPVGMAVLLFLSQFFGDLAFRRFVAAQITKLHYPPFSPPPNESYDVGAHWKSFFESYFPDLIKTLFHKYLPALYVGVPTAIVEAIGNLFDDTNLEIPSVVQMWEDFADYMEDIKVVLDIDKLIDLNYYARVLVACVEGVLLLGAMGVSALQPMLEKIVEQTKQVADTIQQSIEQVVRVGKEATLSSFDELLAGAGQNDIDLETLQACVDSVTNDQMTLLLQTNNMPELAALLGTAPIADMQRYRKLTAAVKQNNVAAVSPLGVNYEDLLRQDGDGNVAMHHVTSVEMFRTLYAINPGSLHILNDNGESPLCHMLRKGLKAADLLPTESKNSASAQTDATEKFAMDLLTPDKNGICPAMELPVESHQRIALERLLPSWEEVREVLGAKTSADLSERKQMLVRTFNEMKEYGHSRQTWPFDVWHVSMCLNVFGEEEVWKNGEHTNQSRDRLASVGSCLSMLLTEYEILGRSDMDNHHIATLVREIFLATKGPNHANFDSREPYWKDVKKILDEMAGRTKSDLDEAYSKLPTAITHDIPKFESMQPMTTTGKLMSDSDARRSAELRQDFGNHWCHKGWANSKDSKEDSSAKVQHHAWNDEMQAAFAKIPYLIQAAKDFVLAGFISGPNATKDFKAICEGRLSQTYKVIDNKQLQIMRCDAQFRRDTCNQYQEDVKQAFVKILRECKIEPIDANIQARPKAKGMPRLLEKVHELLTAVEEDEGIFARAKEQGLEESLRFELRTAGDFIIDVNGVTLIVDTQEQFTGLYEYIKTKDFKQHGCQLLRVKNAFHHTKKSPYGYRDTKLWVAVDPFIDKKSANSFPLVCEVQLHLREFYKCKERLMHLHYEIVRGSYDHPHVQTLRENTN